MFISAKRHEREIKATVEAVNLWSEALLKHVSQGIFFLDVKNRILPPISHSLSKYFGRRDFSQMTFEKLLRPMLEEAVLNEACAQLAEMRAAAERGETAIKAPLQSVAVRLARSDGGFDTARYQFEFFKVDLPEQHDAWMVCVTDRTAAHAQPAAAQTSATAQLPAIEDLRPQLDELHGQLRIQAEILRSVMQTGRMRFAASVQRSGAAMKAINAILKKPARDEAAFRHKLEEISAEAAHIRREATTLQLAGLETAARLFEESLQELRNRESLSGNDFLPLAIQLDALFGQFALLRSLTHSAAQAKPKPKPDLEATRPAPGQVTDNGTQIIAPKFTPDGTEHESSLPGSGSSAAAGTLENTLAALTEHIANEQRKAVALECRGLHKVPSVYQSAVKNVAIQFIRNAVIHGVEEPDEREEAGKPAIALLLLQFSALPDGTFELRFQDDGRGVDPVNARRVAVEKRLITSEAAERLRDRQAIKLIFQDGFTTLPSAPNQPLHGAGLSLVRRYVHDAGGKVALASDPGRETRFKVSLPALVKTASSDQAQVA
ncbi:MAG TPA: ATP-binding protein [Steroidobacteraceae bacterium]|nr:ATP-binding protein [Steroidobacteraceae bacterium]